ncbi:MAG TPA: M12 family metallo-peptidase [Steroidobacteraceae bacterium]|nr:M12 family metallo-peptidase [Steroidobacteraceae bacterium]
MSNRSCRPLPGVGLLFVACVAMANVALAAAPYRVLNHEAIQIEARKLGGARQHLSLAAFGKQFELSLRPNDSIQSAVPAARPDIQPLAGTVDGQPGSWVRITRTRAGWRGMLFDGQELYAIEPVGDVGEALVQPHSDSPTAPVMYRLADAIMTVGSGFCATVDADGSPADTESPAGPGTATNAADAGSVSSKRLSAVKVFAAIAADLNGAAPQYPTKRLLTGVVADYEFSQAFADPQGAIIARMNIVDGIFSSQVGVKITLAPVTVITTPNEPFTTTVPNDLLSQLRTYRSNNASQSGLGVTHLMTGRNLDGDIVGISYQGTICNGATSAGLSEGWHSTTMSALIAAHELGHNFNAPHDGVPGACASTPQTYLMSPMINGSNQFSDCSLQQIQARIQSAQCLTQYNPPDVSVMAENTLVGAAVNSPFTVSLSVSALGDDASNDVSTAVTIPASLTVRSATVAGTACAQASGSLTCPIGSLAPGETREIDIELAATSTGTSTVSFAVTSSNESNTANDSGTVTANITDVTPAVSASTATATSSSGGSGAGGGGGGQIDVGMLALLSLALAIGARSSAFRRVAQARRTSRSFESTC